MFDHRSNILLAKLPTADLSRLVPHLEPLDLPLRYRIEERGKPIDYVYFPVSGIVSVVAKGVKGQEIEVGLIGFEGMTGAAMAMGKSVASHTVYMQVAGAGFRMPAETFTSALDESQALNQTVLRYMHLLFVQTTQTALCNGHCTVPERLARWLLMAQDRVKSNELPLTHEFLSIMLGVRRAGVTSAVRVLTEGGHIEPGRGTITVRNREGLVRASNGAYVFGEEMDMAAQS